MEKPPHILVIGAGLIGLSAADRLLASGAEVTLIDLKPGPGLGASFCNSGMIHPSQAAPWFRGAPDAVTSDVLDLARSSKPLLLARARELGVGFDHRDAGALQLFADRPSGESAKARLQDLGVHCLDVTGAPYTFGLYALSFPEDASGNARVYTEALAADIARKGGRFFYNIAEPDIETFSIAADHVVIAAGAGSAAVGRIFGVDIPVASAAGHALNFKRPDMDLPSVPIMHAESRSALTVFRDHVRLSGTVGITAPSELLSIWREIAPTLVPSLGAPISEWSGERPMCQLGRPIIGPSGEPNVWINTGHGHMGWTLCAASGDLMARMILGGHHDRRFEL